jgi:hypothetical protein
LPSPACSELLVRLLLRRSTCFGMQREGVHLPGVRLL